MKSNLEINPNKLRAFHGLKKRKIYVGELIYDTKKDVYQLIYDEHYINSKKAIPLGPELNLFKTVHTSPKGELFPAFIDRIPQKENPAYSDYCLSAGISPDEQNKIILLGAIGRKGPSTFVFEPVYQSIFTIETIKKLRADLRITQHDLAKAFDISKVTLQRIEAGESNDIKTLKLLQIYFMFPEVAIWQLRQSGSNIHSAPLLRLIEHFKHSDSDR